MEWWPLFELEWWHLFVMGALVFAGLITFLYTSRAGVVARATTKEAIRQPIFLLILGLSMVFLVVNTFLPFFSLGEDVKMQKDCGLATILIGCLLLAAWTASTSISAEIEGKTTMTLLSKPINRRQFVLGKYVGVLQTILFMLLPLAICFLALIYYKVGYDAAESSTNVTEIVEWRDVSFLPFQWPFPTPERWAITTQIMPGLLLIFFEAAILTAISVAIATRAPMIVNIVSCLSVYIVAH
ncbi:MAG: ABC transporter permease subunit, partial [Planctomycetes bacterium]|nr:ABC transporter permease subunit [Planctomycetota bacterium]